MLRYLLSLSPGSICMFFNALCFLASIVLLHYWGWRRPLPRQSRRSLLLSLAVLAT